MALSEFKFSLTEDEGKEDSFFLSPHSDDIMLSDADAWTQCGIGLDECSVVHLNSKQVKKVSDRIDR